METQREKWTRYMRTYRAKYPERVKLARRKQYITRKKRAMDKVGGAICKRCGCDELDFLEFNHKNGGGCKEYKKTKYAPMTDKILTHKRNIDDLEILCRVCNALEFLERKNNKQSKKFEVKWK